MTDFSKLPAFDKKTGDLNIVVETPRGRRNKYAYDPKARTFRLKRVLPEGASFPYDFGFIPSTLGQDGDPLDVLVFLEEPAMAGCIIAARLIGVIEAEQTEKGKTERNDRLLAVSTHARSQEHVGKIDDLRPGMLDEIEEFFKDYNQQDGKEFKPIGRQGPKKARALVDKGRRAYNTNG
jgi:inorganic pyrophosphatase